MHGVVDSAVLLLSFVGGPSSPDQSNCQSLRLNDGTQHSNALASLQIAESGHKRLSGEVASGPSHAGALRQKLISRRYTACSDLRCRLRFLSISITDYVDGLEQNCTTHLCMYLTVRYMPKYVVQCQFSAASRIQVNGNLVKACARGSTLSQVQGVVSGKYQSLLYFVVK